MKLSHQIKAAFSSVVLSICMLASPLSSDACTNIIVGKKASADGSVICTYNCDGFGFSGSLKFTPAGAHEKGEKIAIRAFGSGGIKGYVDQVDYTYGVIDKAMLAALLGQDTLILTCGGMLDGVAYRVKMFEEAGGTAIKVVRI